MILTDTALFMLNDVLQHVTDHPDEWDQGHYGTRDECGTAGCVAGHLLIRHGEPAGYMPLWEYVQDDDFAPELVRDELDTTYLRAVQPPSGADIEPGHAALRVLGLQVHSEAGQIAFWLFNSTNTLQHLWFYGQMLAQGRLAVPAGVEPVSAGHEHAG